MRLQLIHTFLAVAEAGNPSAAAQVLRYSESSVAYHIRDLEKILGVRLFEKSSNGLRLTTAGEAILDPASEIVRTAERMSQIVKSLDVGRAGHRTRLVGSTSVVEPFAVPAQRRDRRALS